MSDADNQVGGTGEPFSQRDQDGEDEAGKSQKEHDREAPARD